MSRWGVVTEALLTWYRAHARDLPWRRGPSAYEVLLSELMLQQTRVDTVIPYFETFVDRWPTLADLADAELDDVLHAWAGLGYYARARNLHKCAQKARHGLPDSYEGLLALPGIGPYTAGAVASIAFGRPVPAVDGNVERVLSRVHGLQEDPRSTVGKRQLRALATTLLGVHPPSQVNQALMELGATVCTPRRPSCDACCWAATCVAKQTGQQEVLPRKPPRKKPKPVRGVAGLLRGAGGVLLGRRAPEGLLGGLWEPIRADLPAKSDAAVELVAAFHAVGLRVRVGDELGEVVHVFTHRRLTLKVFEVALVSGTAIAGEPYDAVKFVAEPASVGLSTLAVKALGMG